MSSEVPSSEFLPFLELSLKKWPSSDSTSQTLQTQAQCQWEGSNP